MSKLLTTENGISLKQLFPTARFVGTDDILVQSCCGQWDECQQGDLFVAVVDEQTDGHLFSLNAQQQGATAVLGERMVPNGIPQCLVPDSRQAYAEICQALAGLPSQRLVSIGVTGSYGKTMVTHLVDSVLRAGGQHCGRLDSVEVSVSGRKIEAAPESLTPPKIASSMARIALEGCSHFVFEANSRQLAKNSLSGTQLDVAILTNVRQKNEHFHGSGENYRNAMLRLFSQLKHGGVGVVNVDDPVSHFLLENLDHPVLTIGMKQQADVQGEVIESDWGTQTILISAGRDSVVVTTPMMGKSSVYNILSAIAAGLVLGMDLSTIAEGIESCRLIPGRMESVACGQDFGVLIDAADTSESLSSTLAEVKKHEIGRIITVLCAHDSQTSDQRYHLGRVAEKQSDILYVSGGGSKQALEFEPIHQVLDGLKEPKNAIVSPDRIMAIESALAQAKPHDVVVVSGRGHRAIASCNDGRWTISDSDVCRAWLYENAEELGSEPDPSIYQINDFRRPK